MQRTVLHQHRRDVTAALVQRRFDHRTHGLLVRVGLQVEHLGLQQHLLQQFVQIQTLLGRNLLILVFAAPRLHQIVHLRELLLDVVGVGLRLVDLVDGEDHRNSGCLGVVDGLDGLRHDVVVRRHDDDRHVRHGRTARTHRREGLVARRIEERDLLTVQLHAVRSDVLRDTAGLAFDDVRLADVVQQRRLTVVDVAHHRHDRRARNQILLLVLLVGDGLLDVCRDELDLEAELLGHDDQRFGIQPLIDRHHQSEVHARRDHLRRRDVHHRRQLTHGDELRHLEGRTFHLFAFELLVHALGDGLTLVAAVFCTLALGSLGRQAGQRILDLLRNLLVAHFRTQDRFRGILVLVAASFARTGLVLTLASAVVLAALAATVVLASLVTLAALPVAVAALLRTALLGLVDVDLLLLQPLALVLAARNKARNVHRSQHLRACERHRRRTENVVFRSLGLRSCGGLLRGRSCRGGRSRRLCRGCRGFRSFRCCTLLRSRGCGRTRLFRLRGRFRALGGRRCRYGRSGFRNAARLRCRGRLCGRGGSCLRLLLNARGGLLRGRLRGRGRLGFGRKVDLPQEFRLRNLVLHADDIAFDDNLLFFLALLLLRFFEGDGRLFLGDTFPNRVAGAHGTAVRTELLLQNGIRLRVDQRVGRPVALDALLLQEVRDGVQTDLELLGNLNEP